MTSTAKDVLLCALCRAPYDAAEREAKWLSCHHCFCLSCLLQLAQNKRQIKCPLEGCRKKTAVPREGASALPRNDYVDHFQQLVFSESSSDQSATSSVGVAQCAKHMGQPLLFYCETCSKAICMNCTVLDHDKASGHVIRDIATVAQLHQEILVDKRRKLDASLRRQETNRDVLRREMDNLQAAKTAALRQLDSTFDELWKSLARKQQEFQESVESHCKKAEKTIVEEAERMKKHQQRLTGLRANVAERATSRHVAQLMQVTMDQDFIRELEEVCEQRDFELVENNYVQFDARAGLDELTNALNAFGQVTCDKPLPSIVTVVMPAKCVASTTVTIEVHVEGINKGPLNGYPIKAVIVDPLSESPRTSVAFKTNGVHCIQFVPEMPGLHKCDIHFLDEPLLGTASEFQVSSNNPVQRFGEGEGNGPGQLYHPTSVAIDPRGNVYVADMGNKRVQVYGAGGNPIGQFKIGGSNSTTYGLAMSHVTEELFCTKVGPNEAGESQGQTVHVYTPSGERKRAFTNPEMRKGLFLAVDSRCHVIVTDSAANCVHVYNKDGVPISKFGKAGDKEGQFNFPSALCVGRNDTIIVTDTGNHRVQIFSAEGKFLSVIGSYGGRKGQFKLPRGVASDDSGCVLVADSQNRIQVFDATGAFLSCIDSADDPINDPYNLAVSNDGHVFVADFKNSCVKKYKYK